MWLLYAAGSAFFAGVTAVLAKCGIRRTDSTVATALRTCVVLVMAWVMVPVSGQWGGLHTLTGQALLFLVLSGLCTGASWLCYFKALQIGDINKVVPVDKTSTVLTILLALIFLGEGITPVKTAAMALIMAGTWLMIEKKQPRERLPPGMGGSGTRRDLRCLPVLPPFWARWGSLVSVPTWALPSAPPWC